MLEYNKANFKLSDLQLIDQKSAVKNQTREALRMNIKMSDGNNFMNYY